MTSTEYDEHEAKNNENHKNEKHEDNDDNHYILKYETDENMQPFLMMKKEND